MNSKNAAPIRDIVRAMLALPDPLTYARSSYQVGDLCFYRRPANPGNWVFRGTVCSEGIADFSQAGLPLLSSAITQSDLDEMLVKIEALANRMTGTSLTQSDRDAPIDSSEASDVPDSHPQPEPLPGHLAAPCAPVSCDGPDFLFEGKVWRIRTVFCDGAVEIRSHGSEKSRFFKTPEEFEEATTHPVYVMGKPFVPTPQEPKKARQKAPAAPAAPKTAKAAPKANGEALPAGSPPFPGGQLHKIDGCDEKVLCRYVPSLDPKDGRVEFVHPVTKVLVAIEKVSADRMASRGMAAIVLEALAPKADPIEELATAVGGEG